MSDNTIYVHLNHFTIASLRFEEVAGPMEITALATLLIEGNEEVLQLPFALDHREYAKAVVETYSAKLQAHVNAPEHVEAPDEPSVAYRPKWPKGESLSLTLAPIDTPVAPSSFGLTGDIKSVQMKVKGGGIEMQITLSCPLAPDHPLLKNLFKSIQRGYTATGYFPVHPSQRLRT